MQINIKQYRSVLATSLVVILSGDDDFELGLHL